MEARTDAFGAIPLAVARCLGDQKMEVRKKAASEIAESVKIFLRDTKEGKAQIEAVISSIHTYFVRSAQGSYRKGGLGAISVIAVTIGNASAPSGTALSSVANMGSPTVSSVPVASPPAVSPTTTAPLPTNSIATYLSILLTPALECLTDQDPTIRFATTETLYNIVKIARCHILQAPHFADVFNSLCVMSADAEARVASANDRYFALVLEIVCEATPGEQFKVPDFIALLTRNMKTNNPYIRKHLMSWIIAVENIPCVNLVQYLNLFLEGLLSMLSDQNVSIVTQANGMLDSFLVKVKKQSDELDLGALVMTCVQFHAAREENTKLLVISWIGDLLEIGGSRLLPMISNILPAVLSLFSDPSERIRTQAGRANDEMAVLIQRAGSLTDTPLTTSSSITTPSSLIGGHTMDKATLGAILSSLIVVLERPDVPTRMGTLNWFRLLLDKYPDAVKGYSRELTPALMEALTDNSVDVCTLVIRVLAVLASAPADFAQLMQNLVDLLYSDQMKLMTRAGYIVKRIAIEVRPEDVYRELARVLPAHPDKDFVDNFVSTLSVLLYTSQEMYPLREALRKGISSNPHTCDVFRSLYPCWSYNAVSALSLCLLCGAHEHAYRLVLYYSEMEATVSLLVQLDKMVQLLESPAFAHVRVALLEPGMHPYLVKALFGVMMLLPQSTAHSHIAQRLKCVETMILLQQGSGGKLAPPSTATTTAAPNGGITAKEWDSMLESFKQTQSEIRSHYEKTLSSANAVSLKGKDKY